MLVINQEKENEESRGTEGARRATGVAHELAEGKGPIGPDPEVTEKAQRRRFDLPPRVVPLSKLEPE